MRIRAFKEPETLAEMLLLRLMGAKREDLAKKYNVDVSSIYHWCNKFGVQPIFFERKQYEPTTITFNFASTKQYKYQHLFDEEEQLNEGKSYIQIRVQSRKRELIRQGTL